MHRHDDVDEILFTYRADHARAGVCGCLQGDVWGVNDFQDFAQELNIERNQLRLAIDGGIHHRLVIAGLLRLPRDLHLPGLGRLTGLDIDARDVRAFPGKDLGLFASFQEGRG